MNVLVAPLDWGLGHAARCIPIIRYLQEKGCTVLIGADGRPLQLLQHEFPSLEFITLSGYGISYPERGSMALKMAMQIPKILSGIKREHEQLIHVIQEKKIDAVISDNRYGLWSDEVPCAFITHQIKVKSPFGEKFLHRLNKRFIAKYTECWIPDLPDEKESLSGGLSHGFPLPENADYIGVLSRFRRKTDSRIEKGRKLLVLLSGPEPQRTIFEKKIIEQLISGRMEKNEVLIVQGITEKSERRKISETIEMVSHLPSSDLEKEIASACLILSRPGYSTIMDLAALGKKAIFVPTPGQTEQEYLAKYLLIRKVAFSAAQGVFRLDSALEESEYYTGFRNHYPYEEFKRTVDGFLRKGNTGD